MSVADNPSLSAVLASLERETTVLLDRVLDIFLDFDFLDHRLVNGTSGGEVVTHLSREADRMADSLAAATGQSLSPADPERDWSIEQNGGLRPGAVLVHDLHESAGRLRVAIAGVEDWEALSAEVREIPGHRLVQVVVHDADLDRPWNEVADEDAAIAVSQLSRVFAEELRQIRLVVRPDSAGLRATSVDDIAVVEGRAQWLLAWTTGRITGLEIPESLPALTPRTHVSSRTEEGEHP